MVYRKIECSFGYFDKKIAKNFVGNGKQVYICGVKKHVMQDVKRKNYWA